MSQLNSLQEKVADKKAVPIEHAARPTLQIRWDSLQKTLDRISHVGVKKITADAVDVFKKRAADFNQNTEDSLVSIASLQEDMQDLEGLITGAQGQLVEQAYDVQSTRLAQSIFTLLIQAMADLRVQPPYNSIALADVKHTSGVQAEGDMAGQRLRLEQGMLLPESSPLSASFYAALQQVAKAAASEHKPPKGIFICYAWPDLTNPKERHLSWLQSFLSGLRDHLKAAGLGSTILDIRDNPAGGDIYHYMNAAKESSHVLLIGTESLLRKHNEGGAVRTELIHIKRKMKEDREKNLYRVIPILLSGTPEAAFPAEYELYSTIQFWREKSYFTSLRGLIASLYSIPKPAINDAFKLLWKEFLDTIGKENAAVFTQGLNADEVSKRLATEKAQAEKDSQLHADASRRLLTAGPTAAEEKGVVPLSSSAVKKVEQSIPHPGSSSNSNPVADSNLVSSAYQNITPPLVEPNTTSSVSCPPVMPAIDSHVIIGGPVDDSVNAGVRNAKNVPTHKAKSVMANQLQVARGGISHHVTVTSTGSVKGTLDAGILNIDFAPQNKSKRKGSRLHNNRPKVSGTQPVAEHKASVLPVSSSMSSANTIASSFTTSLSPLTSNGNSSFFQQSASNHPSSVSLPQTNHQEDASSTMKPKQLGGSSEEEL